MILTNPRTSATFDPSSDKVSLHMFDPSSSVGAVIELSPDGAAALVNSVMNAIPRAAKHEDRARRPAPSHVPRSTFKLELPPLGALDKPIRRR